MIYLTVEPSDLGFLWQLEVQLQNLKELDLIQYSRNLIFIPNDRVALGVPVEWRKLEERYSEAKFFYYFDTGGECLKDIQQFGYIPLLRPWCLIKHWEQFPELERENIWYWDADCIFSKKIDFSKYLNDNIHYLSFTGVKESNYLDSDYFEKKIKDCLPGKEEELTKIDVLDTLVDKVTQGILCKQDIIDNKDNTGGAQYLLKNIDVQFWKDVYLASKQIKFYLSTINKLFFKNENSGYQSFCADMWAVLWNIWKRDIQTRCPEELDFSWATDTIEKVNKLSIYHNAGVSDVIMNMAGENVIMFSKRKPIYINNIRSPHKDKEYLKSISPKFGSYYYTQKLLAIKDPIW